MTDAGAAPKVGKSAKAGASGADSKKDKFEVKKVCGTLRYTFARISY